MCIQWDYNNIKNKKNINPVIKERKKISYEYVQFIAVLSFFAGLVFGVYFVK